MRSPLTVAALVALALLCVIEPATCGIIRVKPTGIDINNGSTWGLAKKTIGSALAVSASGDEIWVAAGTYVENITLKDGVALYAGFVATEATRTQRDWRANATIIDGGAKGSVVTSPMSATSSTRIDGFTIRNGTGTPRAVSGSTYYLGGGVLCPSSSPTITNCTISANSVSHSGAGIYLENSSAVISNCTIIANHAGWNGPGIHCEGSSPDITNNMIVGNSITGTTFGGAQGGGIFCGGSSSPKITNNTIVVNTTPTTGASFGGGICCASGSSPVIVNNVIDSNSSGIYSAGSPTLHHNCLHSNNQKDYVGLQAGANDITSNPLFISAQTSNFHLQATSPCLDKGDDAAVPSGWLDIDGQSRKYGSSVDMGADEYWPPPTVTISSPTTDSAYVSVSANLTIGGTASTGVASVVWVSDRGGSGKCTGTTTWSASAIVLQPGMNVITVTARDAAGFAATDTLSVTYSAGQVDAIHVKPTGNDANTGASWALAKRTIQDGIDTADAGEEVWVAAGTYAENIELKNGVAVYGGFAGTESSRDARRIARNPTIIDGRKLDNAVKALTGTGDTTRIDGFTIRNGSSSTGGGIYCLNSQATIANNVITNCSTSQSHGGGLFLSGGGVVVANNLIYKNSAPTGNGGAIYLYSCGKSTTIVSNTIVDNDADGGGGIYAYNCATHLPISNNIVAFNSSGIAAYGTAPAMTSNDVSNNTDYNYSGTASAGTSDISLNPLFVDRATRDYHLQNGTTASPCIDAGWTLASGLESSDIDGQSRVNGVVDIGADEVWPDAWIVFSSPTSDPNYITSSPTLDIGGTASDGVLEVTWSNNKGGSGTCSGGSQWSASWIALTAGANVITVTADTAIETASTSLTVFYDATPPAVAITSPTADPTYATRLQILMIGGTSSDDTEVTAVNWANDRGGAGACTGTATWSAAGIVLLPGANIITVTATDAAGKSAVAQLAVTFTDATPPVIAITTPTTSPTYPTKNATITLGGTATDDVGVTGVSWANDRGGSGACTGASNWTASSIPLLVGANVITVTATDSTGNKATDVITANYDNSAPSLAITSPTTAATYGTNTPSVDLAGTASDNTSVALVTWSSDQNASGTCTGTTAWEAKKIALRPGANVITVIAGDPAGNKTNKTLAVTFTDITAPKCTISTPSSDANYSTTSAKLTVTGTAADDAGVTSVTWSNSRGGGGACTGKGSWSVSNIQLCPGINPITVTATDTSGNTGHDIINVTFTDITPPVVTITGPTTEPDLIRTCATVTLSGTASDDVEVTTIYWSSDKGGQDTCTGTTSWAAPDIALQPGANVITLTARDSSDNATTTTITVVSSSAAPGNAWNGLCMVAVPVVPDITDPKQAVGFGGNYWLTYSTSTLNYTQYPDQLTWFAPPSATPGRGFWANFTTTAATPCGSAPPQNKAFTIHLVTGWNLVGHPFLSPVMWDADRIQVQQPGVELLSLRDASNAVPNYAWGWDNLAGNYYLVTEPAVVQGAFATLDPWRAYWIRAFIDCDLILPAP